MKKNQTDVVLAADTSFLLSLLGTDTNTEAAMRIIGSLSCPLTLSPLNDLELLNSAFMAEFQGFKEEGSAAVIKQSMKTERDAGRFVYPPFNPAKAVARATELSRKHTLTGGHRTYDVLLVAAALEMKATDFLTFDARQAKLAESEGLKVRAV